MQGVGHTSNEFQSAGQLEWQLLVEIRKIILHRGEIEVGPSRLITFGPTSRDVPVTKGDERAGRITLECHLDRRIPVGIFELDCAPGLQYSLAVYQFQVDIRDVITMNGELSACLARRRSRSTRHFGMPIRRRAKRLRRSVAMLEYLQRP